MPDSPSVPHPPRGATRRLPEVLAWGSGGVAGCVGLLALASWSLSPDLEHSTSGPLADWSTTPSPTVVEEAGSLPTPVTWPETIQEGEDAKRALLAILEEVERMLRSKPGYRARFKRLERIDGELGPWRTVELKVFHDPMSVYMRFLEPEEGKEAIYSHGRFDNQLIAHPGGMARLLAPRLKLDPNGTIAMMDNRHPITSAGLLNLVQRLLHFRRLDLNHSTSYLRLDQTETPDGRVVFRSRHRHLIKTDQQCHYPIK